MADTEAEYRKLAEKALATAASVPDPELKASWLSVALEWKLLADKAAARADGHVLNHEEDETV